MKFISPKKKFYFKVIYVLILLISSIFIESHEKIKFETKISKFRNKLNNVREKYSKNKKFKNLNSNFKSSIFMEKLKVLLIGFIQALANKVYKNEQFAKETTYNIINNCLEKIKQEYKNLQSGLIKQGCDSETLNNLLEKNDNVYQICSGIENVKFIDEEYFSFSKKFNHFSNQL